MVHSMMPALTTPRNGFFWPERLFAKPQYKTTGFVEKDDHYLITALVPGVKKDQVTLQLEGEILRLRAQGDHPFCSVNIDRAWTLPKDASADTVSAQVENGVLTVHIAKELPEKEDINITWLT